MEYENFTTFYHTRRFVVSCEYWNGILSVTIMSKEAEEWQVIARVEDVHNKLLTPFTQYRSMLKSLHSDIREYL